MATRTVALGLYRQICREANKFQTHNYKAYTLRRTREEFRKHRDETDPQTIQQLLTKATETRDMVHRQATINSVYAKDDSILNFRIKAKPSRTTTEWVHTTTRVELQSLHGERVTAKLLLSGFETIQCKEYEVGRRHQFSFIKLRFLQWGHLPHRRLLWKF